MRLGAPVHQEIHWLSTYWLRTEGVLRSDICNTGRAAVSCQHAFYWAQIAFHDSSEECHLLFASSLYALTNNLNQISFRRIKLTKRFISYLVLKSRRIPPWRRAVKFKMFCITFWKIIWKFLCNVYSIFKIEYLPFSNTTHNKSLYLRSTILIQICQKPTNINFHRKNRIDLISRTNWKTLKAGRCEGRIR